MVNTNGVPVEQYILNLQAENAALLAEKKQFEHWRKSTQDYIDLLIESENRWSNGEVFQDLYKKHQELIDNAIQWKRENLVLRQQVDALSRALESDEYKALVAAVGKYADELQNAYESNTYHSWVDEIDTKLLWDRIVYAARAFTVTTEALKTARAGSGDGEAG